MFSYPIAFGDAVDVHVLETDIFAINVLNRGGSQVSWETMKKKERKAEQTFNLFIISPNSTWDS